MVRAGLGPEWECLFANDFDEKKREIYRRNWKHEPNGKDIALVTLADLPREIHADGQLGQLPRRADFAWASFPCQDLSQAGKQLGLNGHRSGCFYPFWDLLNELIAIDRGPRIIAVENVSGTLTANDQEDVAIIADTFAAANYRFGFVIIDAVDFVPQSRPRFFAIGVSPEVEIPHNLLSPMPNTHWHPPGLVEAVKKFSRRARRNWVWWNLPLPPPRENVLADLIQDRPTGVKWHTQAETRNLLRMMSDRNRMKVDSAVAAARTERAKKIGAIYRRTRSEKKTDPRTKRVTSKKHQRAEVRFDEVAGCLRTPGGGSSRQTIMVVSPRRIRSRLLSPREAARLMGLPENFKLPANYNAAYHFAGDGVVVPVVSFIRDTLLNPLLTGNPH